jgi:antirestriction protein ArdC
LEAHKARLDRDLKGKFGQAAYAAEELIAELGAAFLAAEFSFDGDVRHAGDIESWLSLLLHSDKRRSLQRRTRPKRQRGHFISLS